VSPVEISWWDCRDHFPEPTCHVSVRRAEGRSRMASSVFRHANLTHLEGGSASKIDPLNLFLLGCPLLLEADGGDADCGDDWPDTARSFGQGQVDPVDRSRPEAVAQHGAAGASIGRDVFVL